MGRLSAASLPSPAVLAAALAVAGVAYVWVKKQPGQSLAAAAGAAAVEAATDAAAGAVVGVGDVFGIPATSKTQCDIDLANGDTWAASFSCPASRWFSEGVMGNTPPPDDGKTGTW
jgi:hypothetical protein